MEKLDPRLKCIIILLTLRYLPGILLNQIRLKHREM